MGKDDGFATFLSDELPGFESLNGSAFFDQARDWDAGFSDDDSSSNPANDDGGDFDDGGFEIVRSAQQVTEVKKEVFFFDSEDDTGVDEETMAAFDQLLASKEARVPRSSRQQRGGERPKGDRKKKKKSPDGKRKLRRNKSAEPKEDDKLSSSAHIRRVKTAQGTTRTMRRPTSKRPEKRGERKSGGGSTGLDLGAKLNNLAPAPADSAALSRRSSNRELGVSDEVSVVSRGVQSCAGLSVGRARRRRATQGQALLARNLQHYDLAGADDEIIKKSSAQKVDVKRRQRRQTHQPLPIAA